MNPEKDREFDSNINQLIWLLKKIIKGLPIQGQGPQGLPAPGKETSINLNLCFFNFLPLAPEDLEELEEIYDQYFPHEERAEEFTPELSPSDEDFLRRNGIRF